MVFTANSRQMASFKSSVIPDGILEDAVSWIAQTLSPEQVFGRDELHEWAKENGYVEAR